LNDIFFLHLKTNPTLAHHDLSRVSHMIM